jgi:energy-coupling factor transporter ATP-binding protein EcfA2
MKVLNYQAHNVLRVSDVDFDLQGRHLFVVGGSNGHGKSSALTALLMVLCGKSGLEDYPSVPLKKDEDEGFVKVALEGGMTAELKLKRNKRSGAVLEEFKVYDAEGKEQAEPRALLKRLCELRGFDPLAFERLDKKAKRELLSKVVGLDLSAQKSEYKKKYEERTRIGNDGKRAKSHFESLPVHKDAPTEEVSTADLMAELDRRQKHNDANAAEREKLAGLKTALAANDEKHSLALAKVAELEESLVAARSACDLAERKGETLGQQIKAQTAMNAVLADKSLDEVRQQIAASGDTNSKVRANKSKEDARVAVESLRKQYEALDKALADNLAAQEKALQEAPWPVPGLSLDDEGVMLDGLPIEQASRAKRIMTSVKIGMALNPKLRLLVCQDGSDLDTETLAALEQILAENDFQMLIELVTRTAADEELCAVVIKDGSVK